MMEIEPSFIAACIGCSALGSMNCPDLCAPQSLGCARYRRVVKPLNQQADDIRFTMEVARRMLHELHEPFDRGPDTKDGLWGRLASIGKEEIAA